MTTYTIDSENNFTAFASAKEANSAPAAERFTSAKKLTRLAEKWPAGRLAAIWNGLPGVAPVKRFTSRKNAVVRIWAAIQSLEPKPNAGPRPPRVRPKKGGPPQQAQHEKTPTARDGSKKAEVLALLRREGGATLQDLMIATGWQAHSLRGFLSGALRKKMGLTVESAKREDRERVYSIGS